MSPYHQLVWSLHLILDTIQKLDSLLNSDSLRQTEALLAQLDHINLHSVLKDIEEGAGMCLTPKLRKI